jgi:hypothetical protein
MKHPVLRKLYWKKGQFLCPPPPPKCNEIQFYTIPCVSRERWLLGLGFCNHITGDKTSQTSLRHKYKTSYIYGRSVFPLEYESRGANGYYIYLPSCRLVHSTCSPSKLNLHHKAFLYIGCPTHYPTRHFFNDFTTKGDIATKFEADLPHRVRNVKEKNVLLFKFRCNIFIGVRIIKEMLGSVASGTPCMFKCSSIQYSYNTFWRK